MLAELTRRWRRWVAHNRVRVTIIVILIYVAFSNPHWSGLAVGVILIIMGQAARFWGAGYLEKNVKLARGGPYRLVRHPLYFGSFLMGLGLAFSVEDAAWWTFGYLLLFIAFFLPAIHVEELRLQSIFGAEYQDLMVEVPGLLPRLTPPPSPPQQPVDTSFSWARVVSNREVRSVVAMVAIVALQAVKILSG
jgi:protein-S-isoprenylcysteine O-methyltransferase Ste14